MTKFRKKPIAIEAWQWNGEKSGQMEGVCQCEMNRVPHVHTAHVTDFNPAGQMVFLKAGDWIIPEQSGGHYYPCKPDIFAATYEMDGRSETEILRNRLQQAEQDRDSYKEQMIHAQMALHDAKGVKRTPHATSDGVQ